MDCHQRRTMMMTTYTRLHPHLVPVFHWSLPSSDCQLSCLSWKNCHAMKIQNQLLTFSYTKLVNKSSINVLLFSQRESSCKIFRIKMSLNCMKIYWSSQTHFRMVSQELDKLTSVFYASILLLIMNFVMTLSRQLWISCYDGIHCQ